MTEENQPSLAQVLFGARGDSEENSEEDLAHLISTWYRAHYPRTLHGSKPSATRPAADTTST